MGINTFPATASSQSKKTQTITSSGTWTVPNGVTSVDVVCIGAAAAIGGAGAVIKSTVDTTALQGTGITVTVGAAPAAAVNGKGGDTSFGTHMTAGGGFAGDSTSSGFAAPSGTTFISGTTIPATSTLRPFVSTYGGNDKYQDYINYNSTIGLYMTSGAYVSPGSTNSSFYYTSPDLITWTRRARTLVPSTNAIKLFSANNRLFTTFRGSIGEGYFISSTDGINWSTIRSVYPSGTGQTDIVDMMYSSTSTKYYFLNNWGGTQASIISSVSAANVTTTDTSVELAIGTASGQALSGFITNGSNLGIVIGVDYNTSGTYYYSLFNGTTWAAYANCTALSATFAPNSGIYPTSGAWDGSKFTITDSQGNLFTTTNLTTWTSTGVTVSGLYIQGYSGGYYYGNIGNFYAYSANGTTWTKTNVYITNKPSGTTGGYRYVQNGTTLASVANVSTTGLIETFNIASPNTTIAPGFLGKAGGGSPLSLSHGGAGGNGSLTYTWNGSVQGSIPLDSPGIDGYGIVTSSPVLSPNSYGSTNGGAGNPGAVVLTWQQ